MGLQTRFGLRCPGAPARRGMGAAQARRGGAGAAPGSRPDARTHQAPPLRAASARRRHSAPALAPPPPHARRRRDIRQGRRDRSTPQPTQPRHWPRARRASLAAAVRGPRPRGGCPVHGPAVPPPPPPPPGRAPSRAAASVSAQHRRAWEMGRGRGGLGMARADRTNLSPPRQNCPADDWWRLTPRICRKSVVFPIYYY